MSQSIDQFDLILISDSGKPYVIKMKETEEGHEPDRVEELDAAFQDVPLYMRDEGATFAIMPDAPNPTSGCTCTLLNLQSIKASIRPRHDANRAALARARRILQQGGTITLNAPGEAVGETIEGQAPTR